MDQKVDRSAGVMFKGEVVESTVIDYIWRGIKVAVFIFLCFGAGVVIATTFFG